MHIIQTAGGDWVNLSNPMLTLFRSVKWVIPPFTPLETPHRKTQPYAYGLWLMRYRRAEVTTIWAIHLPGGRQLLDRTGEVVKKRIIREKQTTAFIRRPANFSPQVNIDTDNHHDALLQGQNYSWRCS